MLGFAWRSAFALVPWRCHPLRPVLSDSRHELLFFAVYITLHVIAYERGNLAVLREHQPHLMLMLLNAEDRRYRSSERLPARPHLHLQLRPGDLCDSGVLDAAQRNIWVRCCGHFDVRHRKTGYPQARLPWGWWGPCIAVFSGIERGSRCQDAQHATLGGIYPLGAREFFSSSARMVCVERHVRSPLDADESKRNRGGTLRGLWLAHGNFSPLSFRRRCGHTRGPAYETMLCDTTPGRWVACFAFFLHVGTDLSGIVRQWGDVDEAESGGTTGWFAGEERTSLLLQAGGRREGGGSMMQSNAGLRGARKGDISFCFWRSPKKRCRRRQVCPTCIPTQWPAHAECPNQM